MTIRHAALVAGALVAAFLLQAPPAATRTGAATAGEPSSTRVLYPPAGAIVTSSPALVVIVGPDSPQPPAFTLDGEALRVERLPFAEGWSTVPAKIDVPVGSDALPLRSPLLEAKAGKTLWTAAEILADGDHEIALEGVTLATFSSRAPSDVDAATSEQPVLRVHGSPTSRTEALDCVQCHEAGAPGDSPVLGVAPVPATCHSCHAEVDLSVAHEHVMEFLAKCQTCHDPHASTRPRLLIDTRERVCALCHEYGHAM